MKLKNLTMRNVSIVQGNIAKTDEQGNEGFAKGKRILVVAESKLELDDADYALVSKQVKVLVEAGVFEILESAETTLTKAEIIAKVTEEADVDLKDSLNKAELQDKAEALGVEL